MLPDTFIPEHVRPLLSKQDWKAAVRIEWDAQDWETFHDGIAYALFRIARRRRFESGQLDFQI